MLQLETRRLRSFDGTDLAYYRGGTDGPTVVLANGLGGPVSSYRHIMRQLEPSFRLLSWDYRGLYHSGRPPRSGAVSMDDQLRDLEVLLAEENVQDALFIGWSMGVQVCLEAFRRYRDRVSGMVLICGAAGRPFTSVPGGIMLARALPPLLDLGKRSGWLASQVARRLTQWEPFVPVMQRAGFVAPTLDMEIFRDIAVEFASLDFGLYCETLKKLDEHDARSVLAQVDVPTLIIAGNKDRMTPHTMARSMHRAIRGSRLLVVPRGTHYTPVEFPGEVARELASFLESHPRYRDAAGRLGAIG